MTCFLKHIVNVQQFKKKKNIYILLWIGYFVTVVTEYGSLQLIYQTVQSLLSKKNILFYSDLSAGFLGVLLFLLGKK